MTTAPWSAGPVGPAWQAWLDQEDRMVAMKVREFGCFIEYVVGDCPGETPFAYSVGCYGLRHPELLIFGVDQGTATNVINDLFQRVRAGNDLTPGELIELEKWPHRIRVEEVPNPAQIVFTAYCHYRYPPFLPIPTLQLTWDDKFGRFPTEVGYSLPAWVQPRPGAFEA